MWKKNSKYPGPVWQESLLRSLHLKTAGNETGSVKDGGLTHNVRCKNE
jgi:hypothetical protein